ncbi:Imm1 family immunity protein [Streptomyces shenzhenensis]|uniref:Imm1 family immunity protein n=1 Tax=Streptomyces shenzhenensis TaxID=943815 RepID=UPI003828C0D5
MDPEAKQSVASDGCCEEAWFKLDPASWKQMRDIVHASLESGDENLIVLGNTQAGSTYARSEHEVDALVSHIMNDLIQRGQTADGFEVVPELAVVNIVKGKYPEERDERWPNNYLYVSVDIHNGYGALKWWTTNIPEDAPAGDISRFVWTSGTPNPPPFDPELISDPGNPTYYPREAAIPLELVREGLEEFCRARTGQRPECIPWLLLEQSI